MSRALPFTHSPSPTPLFFSKKTIFEFLYITSNLTHKKIYRVCSISKKTNIASISRFPHKLLKNGCASQISLTDSGLCSPITALSPLLPSVAGPITWWSYGKRKQKGEDTIIIRWVFISAAQNKGWKKAMQQEKRDKSGACPYSSTVACRESGRAAEATTASVGTA